MKKFTGSTVVTFLPCLVLLALAMPVYSQTHPDFSGTWIFNQARSTGLPYDMSNTKRFTKTVTFNEVTNQLTVDSLLVLGRVPRKRGEVGYAPVWLPQQTLNLDGSETKLQEVVLSGQWRGEKLELVQRITKEGPRGPAHIILMNEQWELSSDGKMLTIHHTIDSSWAKQDMTLVFERR